MILNNYYNLINNKDYNKCIEYINQLDQGTALQYSDFLWLLDHLNEEVFTYLQKLAFEKRKSVYGNSVYIRGLIEISNFCTKDCYYCGIRKSNTDINRYRYDKDKILSIIDKAYKKGYRTIVLQGGEDEYYNDNRLVEIISAIREKYNDLAITLSLGERSKDSYIKLYQAGANRYLLRHETASREHYNKLHPSDMYLEKRLACLVSLKKIGYQTGAGLMVDSPFQTNKDIAKDLVFLQEFQPQMVGIGPYLVNANTPFKDKDNGDINHVLVIYSLVRLICPNALIPSTTATSSLDVKGRLNALKSGCNVIMINLSDIEKRKDYSLYENKTYQGDESIEYTELIEKDINSVGLIMDYNIGNYQERVD